MTSWRIGGVISIDASEIGFLIRLFFRRRAPYAVSGATAGALSSPFLIHETADAGKVESRAGFCAFHELA